MKVRKDKKGLFVATARWAFHDESDPHPREKTDYGPTTKRSAIRAGDDVVVRPIPPFTERGPRHVEVRRREDERREVWGERW